MTVTQRWREKRDTYRPAGEPIRHAEYDVADMAGDAEPRAFVEAHHYSATYPAARFRFGLFHRGDLAGVAVFSHPSNDRVLTNVFPGVATDSVELGRFVLLDHVPANGETWFLARCFERLRSTTSLRGVVSFSDPVPRWRYAVEQLVAAGAPRPWFLEADEPERRAWLRDAMGRTTTLRHPGNFRYAWRLRGARPAWATKGAKQGAYPKLQAAA